MPEKRVSAEEAQAVWKWMEGRQVKRVKAPDEMPGEYIVDGEAFVLRGQFNHVIPWSNLFRLRFKEIIVGWGMLVCSDNHARELDAAGILSFTQESQPGAQIS